MLEWDSYDQQRIQTSLWSKENRQQELAVDVVFHKNGINNSFRGDRPPFDRRLNSHETDQGLRSVNIRGLHAVFG